MKVSEKIYGAITRILAVCAAIVAFRYPRIPAHLQPFALGIICMFTLFAISIFLFSNYERSAAEAEITAEQAEESRDALSADDFVSEPLELLRSREAFRSELGERLSNLLLNARPRNLAEDHGDQTSYKHVMLRWTQYSLQPFEEEERKRAAAVNSALYIVRQLNAPTFEVLLTPDNEIVIRKLAQIPARPSPDAMQEFLEDKGSSLVN